MRYKRTYTKGASSCLKHEVMLVAEAIAQSEGLDYGIISIPETFKLVLAIAAQHAILVEVLLYKQTSEKKCN